MAVKGKVIILLMVRRRQVKGQEEHDEGRSKPRFGSGL
jgi:hypothetical protein